MKKFFALKVSLIFIALAARNTHAMEATQMQSVECQAGKKGRASKYVAFDDNAHAIDDTVNLFMVVKKPFTTKHKIDSYAVSRILSFLDPVRYRMLPTKNSIITSLSSIEIDDVDESAAQQKSSYETGPIVEAMFSASQAYGVELKKVKKFGIKGGPTVTKLKHQILLWNSMKELFQALPSDNDFPLKCVRARNALQAIMNNEKALSPTGSGHYVLLQRGLESFEKKQLKSAQSSFAQAINNIIKMKKNVKDPEINILQSLITFCKKTIDEEATIKIFASNHQQ